jgi:hypothetical protein
LSMVTTAATLAGSCVVFPGSRGVGPPAWGTVAAMVTTALRPFGHIAAWLVWHSMRVSLLGDLERPQPPAD